MAGRGGRTEASSLLTSSGEVRVPVYRKEAQEVAGGREGWRPWREAGRASLHSFEPQGGEIDAWGCEEATFPQGMWLPLYRKGSFMYPGLCGPTAFGESSGLGGQGCGAPALKHYPSLSSGPTDCTTSHVSLASLVGARRNVLPPQGTRPAEATRIPKELPGDATRPGCPSRSFTPSL